MTIKILSGYTGASLYEGKHETILIALKSAIRGGANLRGANFRGANLDGANLGGAKINWQSHDLISKILLLASGQDTEKRKLSGLILVSRDWCWREFLNTKDPLTEWAIAEMKKWVQPNDGAPEILTKEVQS